MFCANKSETLSKLSAAFHKNTIIAYMIIAMIVSILLNKFLKELFINEIIYFNNPKSFNAPWATLNSSFRCLSQTAVPATLPSTVNPALAK